MSEQSGIDRGAIRSDIFAIRAESRGRAPSLVERWNGLDLAIVIYTTLTAILVAVRFQHVAEPWSILTTHALVLLVVFVLPPRGASWEFSSANERVGIKTLRDAARFLRYSYPLLLVLIFFEEVEQMVHAVAPNAPYWFESYLYAADRFLFGELPAIFMASWAGFPLDEIMHAFYFSYYFILIGGVVIAYVGARRPGERVPGPGFETAITSMMMAFFIAFIWFPWLPARGPWENPALMANLPPFEGVLFTPLIEWIIGGGAQSGGCFPSSHVAGSWGIVLGLARFQKRPAMVLGLLAVGLSLSCVYTRYHHAVDVPAGMLAAVLGAWIAGKVTGGAKLNPSSPLR